MNERAQQLKTWSSQQALLAGHDFQFTMVSGDASFRKYYRLELAGSTYIAVDAPPEHENSKQFCELASFLADKGVCVPRVIAKDFEQGFMLLSDLGDRQLLEELSDKTAPYFYSLAFNELVKLQTASSPDNTYPSFLPLYDNEKLMLEMSLFQDWFCGKLLSITLSKQEIELILNAQKVIADSVLQQKNVCVHRDFHSRNLMLIKEDGQEKIAVIDFQDAVVGPITYDAVSLLKDCYIEWPKSLRKEWLKKYHMQLQDLKILELSSEYNFENFYRNFELMGLQRHLKVLGIFARLSIRDGKDAYLKDLPLTFKYVEQVLQDFPELLGFSDFFLGRVKDNFIALQLGGEE